MKKKKAKPKKVSKKSYDWCFHPDVVTYKTDYSYSYSEQVYYEHTSYKCNKCKKVISAIELENARESW